MPKKLSPEGVLGVGGGVRKDAHFEKEMYEGRR